MSTVTGTCFPQEDPSLIAPLIPAMFKIQATVEVAKVFPPPSKPKSRKAWSDFCKDHLFPPIEEDAKRFYRIFLRSTKGALDPHSQGHVYIEYVRVAAIEKRRKYQGEQFHFLIRQLCTGDYSWDDVLRAVQDNGVDYMRVLVRYFKRLEKTARSERAGPKEKAELILSTLELMLKYMQPSDIKKELVELKLITQEQDIEPIINRVRKTLIAIVLRAVINKETDDLAQEEM